MGEIIAVKGPLAPERLGTTLMHEHIMVDFAGAEITGPHRWDRDEVVSAMLPHLRAIVGQGVNSLIECTPAYLGRDPELLRQVSTLTGLHIITNTGFYKAPHLPAWAYHAGLEELANRWTNEFRNGIDGTGVRPGFVKIAVNPGELLPIQCDIVCAAARTHLATGLAVMAHTGDAQAANESLDLIEAEGMSPGRYIVAHADQIGSEVEPGDPAWAQVLETHEALLRRGAWLEYDGIGWGPLARHVALLVAMLERGYERQLLISQDAGWYHVGEAGGGRIQPMTRLLDDFVPAMRTAGIATATMMRLVIDNPAAALALG